LILSFPNKKKCLLSENGRRKGGEDFSARVISEDDLDPTKGGKKTGSLLLRDPSKGCA